MIKQRKATKEQRCPDDLSNSLPQLQRHQQQRVVESRSRPSVLSLITLLSCASVSSFLVTEVILANSKEQSRLLSSSVNEELAHTQPPANGNSHYFLKSMHRMVYSIPKTPPQQDEQATNPMPTEPRIDPNREPHPRAVAWLMSFPNR